MKNPMLLNRVCQYIEYQSKTTEISYWKHTDKPLKIDSSTKIIYSDIKGEHVKDSEVKFFPISTKNYWSFQLPIYPLVKEIWESWIHSAPNTLTNTCR